MPHRSRATSFYGSSSSWQFPYTKWQCGHLRWTRGATAKSTCNGGNPGANAIGTRKGSNNGTPLRFLPCHSITHSTSASISIQKERHTWLGTGPRPRFSAALPGLTAERQISRYPTRPCHCHALCHTNAEMQCNDIFLHGDFIDEPKTLCPLTAAQWDAVVTFLIADLDTASPPASPFPLHATAQNLPRYTPYFAVKYQHIFRNRFDLKLPGRYERPHPRAVSAVDYPEKADHEWVVEHSLHKTFGRPIDEEEMERRLNVLRRCQPGNPYSMAPLPEEIARGEGEEDQGL